MAVTAIEVRSRSPWFGGQPFGEVGPYEELEGTVHFAVDPDHPRNQIITDLELAPRDADGRVGFSADFFIARPKDPRRGNHRVLFEVVTRGQASSCPAFQFRGGVARSEGDVGTW